MSWTVLGAGGFIGGHLVRHLRSRGESVQAFGRAAAPDLDQPLGTVVYCAGVTADFRWRPFDTIEAHVCDLLPLLRRGQFDSLVYLSSTRVYGPLGVARAPLGADPADPDHLYNLSKMMGESACLTSGHERVRVVRLSNVYGPHSDPATFLGAVVRAATLEGHVRLQSSLDTERDYVDVDDVVAMIAAIAQRGTQRLYDVGFGENRTTARIMAVLGPLTGCTVEVAQDAPTVRFPAIDTQALRSEFGYAPRDLLQALPDLVAACKQQGPTSS